VVAALAEQLTYGIRWRVRAGALWRDVPSAYGPWQTVYGLFRRWQRDGTWRNILTALQGRADAAALITWDGAGALADQGNGQGNGQGCHGRNAPARCAIVGPYRLRKGIRMS
jgi:hypothetical protein